MQLRTELLLHSYRPKPLTTFVIRDPKTRTISKSAFRDRIVHHALCNIIESIFEKGFIYDSYANRKGKGTLAAIQRFDYFLRKASHNHALIPGTNKIKSFVLKADIKKYFENVDHDTLMAILKKKIKDQKVLWLIQTILRNYEPNSKRIGMPLGNLTSQFWANVYLNELDQFVKHRLKAKYYLRYVDDFVILHHSQQQLKKYYDEISHFLSSQLKLQLHPDKSKIVPLHRGTAFLGLRIFSEKKMIQKKNLRRFKHKIATLCSNYDSKTIDYDIVYDFLEGWRAYARVADISQIKTHFFHSLEQKFASETSAKEFNRLINTLQINPNITSLSQ